MNKEQLEVGRQILVDKCQAAGWWTSNHGTFDFCPRHSIDSYYILIGLAIKWLEASNEEATI